MTGATDDKRGQNLIWKLVAACIVIALVVLIVLPALSAKRVTPWFVNDLSNLESIAIGFNEYASDNDGILPSHASLVKDGTNIGEWEFVSHKDPRGQVKPTVGKKEPQDWYSFGSYRFYPTHGLDIDSVPDPRVFVIAYCPPFHEGIDEKDHPTVFLDGRARMLSKDELFELIITQQQQLIQSTR